MPPKGKKAEPSDDDIAGAVDDLDGWKGTTPTLLGECCLEPDVVEREGRFGRSATFATEGSKRLSAR